MQENDIQATARAYLEAFEARNLPGCVGLFSEDARLFFQMVVFQGRQAIETWHRQRFDADLRVLHLDGLSVAGDTATIEAKVTSNKLRAWKMPSLNAMVSLCFENGKIKEAKFGPRLRS